jgi:hypothetical protein
MAFARHDSMIPGLKAAASLITKQFYCMEITAAGTVNLCNAATDVVVGILQNKPVSGEACELPLSGIVKGIAAGVIAVGAWVGTDANGKLVAKTTDKDYVYGQALEAAAADGDIIAVLIRPHFLAA